MNHPTVAVALVNRLKFKHLSLLAALDDTRNVHQAAIAINVAQPSASRMLNDIEEAFGFRIFERNARGMLPTTLGVVTLTYARRVLAELIRFADDLDVKRKGGHGQLTVGAIMGAAPDLLALAIATLKTERPLLNVRILGETSDQVVQLLNRREVDFALGRPTSPMQHNDFSFEPLARETLMLVVRAGHPLVVRESVRLDELTAWPWVVQPVTSPARILFEEELARAGCAAGEPYRMRVHFRDVAIAQKIRCGSDAARVGSARSREQQIACRAATRNPQESARIRHTHTQG